VGLAATAVGAPVRRERHAQDGQNRLVGARDPGCRSRRSCSHAGYPNHQQRTRPATICASASRACQAGEELDIAEPDRCAGHPRRI